MSAPPDFDADGPLPELRDFGLHEDPEFTRRVRRSIERRETTASFVELSSRGLLAVVLQFLALTARVITPTDDQGDA